jgi:uncharacterized membrane protein YbjE (DUF340 family)
MIKILIFFAVGAVLGFFMRHRKKLLKIVDKLLEYSIYLLLFSLGVSVGINQEIVENIHRYAQHALILALGGILGSIVIAYFVYKFFFGENRREK